MKHTDWDLTPSTTRLTTIKRQQLPSFNINEDLINQIAKTRLVEDELFTEKIKSETLERKNLEYIENIGQLEYTINDLRFLLERADLEIKRHSEIDCEIEKYAHNLKEVGIELSELNEVLEKKNKECAKLMEVNSKLKEQVMVLEENYREDQIKREAEKVKIKELLKAVNEEIEPSFNDEILRDMFLIEDGINDLKSDLAQAKGSLEKCRKESSEAIIQEKESLIELQYALKLAQKRNEDLEKRKSMESLLALDKRVESIIDEMLKKEDELTEQISELEEENESLREELAQQKSESIHSVSSQQNTFEKELKLAKETIKDLITEKEVLREKLEEVSSLKEIETNRSMNEEVELSKKYREFGETNKRLKLRISELESDKKMLEKELSIRNM